LVLALDKPQQTMYRVFYAYREMGHNADCICPSYVWQAKSPLTLEVTRNFEPGSELKPGRLLRRATF
jgi:hypothetical protein